MAVEAPRSRAHAAAVEATPGPEPDEAEIARPTRSAPHPLPRVRWSGSAARPPLDRSPLIHAPVETSPKTIDDVVHQLDLIIQHAAAANDTRGLFAAVYREVTRAIHDEIKRGDESRFEDTARMEAFDVVFAGRYLDAYRRFANKEATSECWEAAFEAGKKRLSFVQHVALGINAHINLDLGVAAAAIAPGDALPSLEHDFNLINDILREVSKNVRTKLNRIEPWFRGVDALTLHQEVKVAAVALDQARREAWLLAESLAPACEEERARLVEERDRVATTLAETIAFPRTLSLLLRWSQPPIEEAIRVLHE